MRTGQDYVSYEFHHFVGRHNLDENEAQYEVLKLVLESLKLLRSPFRDKEGGIVYVIDLEGSFLEENFIKPSIVCFCDIPAKDLSIHTSKYGHFGISFPRQFLIERGARPVIYFPHHKKDDFSIHGKQLLEDIEVNYRAFVRLVVDEMKNTAEPRSRSMKSSPKTKYDATIQIDDMLMRDIFFYVKPFDIELSEDDPKNYYMEREWRTPTNINFSLSDITRVFVAPGFKERLQNDIPEYKGSVTVI